MVSGNNTRVLIGSSLIIFSLWSTTVCAQATPDLVTDRPDQTESSVVVPPRFVQVESGVTHTGIEDFTVTEALGTLVRIGLMERLELRIGFDGWISDEIADSEGIGDSELGIKYFLTEENGWIPESAILAGVCIPTAKTISEGDRYDDDLECSCRGASVRWAGSYTLTERLSAGVNLAASWDCEKDADGDRTTITSMPYAAVLGVSLTERLGGFIEFFGEASVDPGSAPANLIDGGFTYLIADNLQLDLAGGAGMTDVAEDWFVGAGVSWRYPR